MRTGYTRREFLQQGLVMVSAATSVPAFLQHTAFAAGDPSHDVACVPNERILVVVQLSGGNDGLNTVVPFGMDGYYTARPKLAVAADKTHILDDDRGIGLHPWMRALHEMIGEGQAAIVQGVGYPNPNRSHSVSMNVWHRGDRGHRMKHGWLGRAMDHLHAGDPTFRGGVVSQTMYPPRAAIGRLSQPMTIHDPQRLTWNAEHLAEDLARHSHRDPVENEGDATSYVQQQLRFIRRTQMDARLTSDKLVDALADEPLVTYPKNRLAQQLQRVTAMMRAGLHTRVHYVYHGSFDLHSQQAHAHAVLLNEFAESLRAFYRELKAMGEDQRVVTMAFTEFGRRVEENASGGTDHGTASPVFLFGPLATPGLYGVHPALTDDALDDGDLVHGMDFRSIYATVLDDWMRIDSRSVLGGDFRPVSGIFVDK